MDKAERFNFVAYGSLLALLGAFASATQVLVSGVEAGDMAVVRASVLIYDTLIQAVNRVPVYGETVDFRTQMLDMLGDHRRYADAVAAGNPDRGGITRDIMEGQLVLDLAFKRLGERLGIGEK